MLGQIAWTMRKLRFWVLPALGLWLLAADPIEVSVAAERGSENTRLLLQEHRQSELDLEVGGELAGMRAGSIRYVSRAELLKLPQVTYTVSDDANFKEPVKISGVLLEDLAKALGVETAPLLMVAICTDQYHANYPKAYVATHHPVLVLKINGQGPDDWPKGAEDHSQYLGPFLISHAKFAPSFKILAHEDEPQIPWGVVRLEFRDEAEVFGAIAPRGPHAEDASAQAGFRIARQNCFRCHSMGAEGGKKAGMPWQVLAIWASASPERFARYVRNPQGVNAKSQMAASPKYDEATIAALIDYFKTFTGEVQ
jgi:mono/diheme cytochrome c family protein